MLESLPFLNRSLVACKQCGSTILFFNMAQVKILAFFAVILLVSVISSTAKARSTNSETSTEIPETKDSWPNFLLVEAAATGFKDNNQLSSYNPKTQEQTFLKSFRNRGVSSPSSFTGSADTICYTLATPPFLECLNKKKPWSPVMYFQSRRDQMRRNSQKPKLELDDLGARLLYLEPVESKLHMIFLNKGNDRVLLLPEEKVQMFAMDWSRGVLATVDQKSQMTIWAFNVSGLLHRVVNFTVETGPSSALMCDTSSSTFYLLGSKNSLGYIRYGEFEAMEFVDLTANVTDTSSLDFTNVPGSFADKSFLYFFASAGKVCRINVTGSDDTTTDCLELPKSSGGTYLEMALYYRPTTSNTDPCDLCSHRCFPKYPNGVTCGCPLGPYGVRPDAIHNKCVSEKTVAAVIMRNQSSDTPVLGIVNYVTQEMRRIDLEAVTGVSGIQPVVIVPLWSSHDPNRFCIVSRHSEELIITCHSYKNVNNFTKVPWKAPASNVTVLAVTHLADTNSSWIVTWLENNEEDHSGCIRYQNTGTKETLTWYCHFDIPMGLLDYANLKMDPEYLAIDPVKLKLSYFDSEVDGLQQVARTSEGDHFDRLPVGSGPDRNSLSWKLSSIGTFFGIRGLTQILTGNWIRSFRMGNPSSGQAVTSRKFLAVVGGKEELRDFCWLETRKNSSEHVCQLEESASKEPQWDNIVCTRTTRREAQDIVAYSFTPDVRVTSFDAQILNLAQHQIDTGNDCITGNHNCSHLCIPLYGSNTKKRYKCACPDEFPILLNERQCSLRLNIDTVTSNGSSIKTQLRPAFSHRITEEEISLTYIGERAPQHTFVSGQPCRIDCQGIVCDKQIIPGTQGATHIIRGHNQLQDEIYWLKPVLNRRAPETQCVYLSAPGKNMTMNLRCFPFSKTVQGQVTVDSERKILFWFAPFKQDPRVPMFFYRRISDHNAVASAVTFPDKDMTYDMLQSIACDESNQKLYSAFHDEYDGTSHLYETSYDIDEQNKIATKTRFFARFQQQITTIAAVKGNLFWYDKSSGWIYGKRPTSNRALRIRKFDRTSLQEPLANFDVTNIASAYTHSEMGLKSFCKDSNCEYFCEVFNTVNGPARQCLCPVNSPGASSQSYVKPCPEVHPNVIPKAVRLESADETDYDYEQNRTTSA